MDEWPGVDLDRAFEQAFAEDWERWWEGMSPAERDAEIRLMDDHVADVQRRRDEGEPP